MWKMRILPVLFLVICHELALARGKTLNRNRRKGGSDVLRLTVKRYVYSTIKNNLYSIQVLDKSTDFSVIKTY